MYFSHSYQSIIQFFSALIEKLSRKNKEKGVGIISFSSSTRENHQRSFEAIDIPSSLPVQVRVSEKFALIILFKKSLYSMHLKITIWNFMHFTGLRNFEIR